MIERSTISPDAAGGRPGDRLAINFHWFHWLRWTVITGQLAALAFCRFALSIEWPWGWMTALIGVLIGSNLALGSWLSWRDQCGWDGWHKWGYALLGSIMALDNFALTAIISLSGGPENPFTIFYLINISLAAVVLHARWAWFLCGLALSCFAFLFWQSELPAPPVGTGHHHVEVAAAPPHAEAMHRHLQGMLLAFAAASALIVYFITRVTTALAQRDSELTLARERKAHHERLESLATLAAGAAHELATPLSTIAVLVRELELDLESLEVDAAVRNEVGMIRVEIDHCRRILDNLASSAGQSVGEELTWTTPHQLMAAVLGETPHARVLVTIDDGRNRYRVPLDALGQSIRALIKNALDASPDDQTVAVDVRENNAVLSIAVIDTGTGMKDDTLRRVGEPFFSTKEPGHGMGLGLFLARQVIERIGGTLTLQSHSGQGTTATIRLLREPEHGSQASSQEPAVEKMRQSAASTPLPR